MNRYNPKTSPIAMVFTAIIILAGFTFSFLREEKPYLTEILSVKVEDIQRIELIPITKSTRLILNRKIVVEEKVLCEKFVTELMTTNRRRARWGHNYDIIIKVQFKDNKVIYILCELNTGLKLAAFKETSDPKGTDSGTRYESHKLYDLIMGSVQENGANWIRQNFRW